MVCWSNKCTKTLIQKVYTIKHLIILYKSFSLRKWYKTTDKSDFNNLWFFYHLKQSSRKPLNIACANLCTSANRMWLKRKKKKQRKMKNNKSIYGFLKNQTAWKAYCFLLVLPLLDACLTCGGLPSALLICSF